MRDEWYGDNRDLVKWGALLWLADTYEAQRVLHLAYYRPSSFGQLEINGKDLDIPEEVVAHFRDLRTITNLSLKIKVTVFDPLFEERRSYQAKILEWLPRFGAERCIVFFDPDTGLQPQTSRPNSVHVLETEAKGVWEAMKRNDVLALYQHRFRDGSWKEIKKRQLAEALELPRDAVKVAIGPTIASDVAILYARKSG